MISKKNIIFTNDYNISNLTIWHLEEGLYNNLIAKEK